MKITKKLTDICLPKQWKTLSLSDLTDEGYLCYGANGIIGHYKEYNHEDEVIMIGCRGSCGSVNISEPKSYINGNAMCLENVDKDVIPKYLYYFLKSCDFGKVITGTSQPQITRTSLSRLDVVIYDMDTQKEIVSILDNVSGLIALTDECISLLENLAKSQFIEMFDPLTNKYNYPIVNISQISNSYFAGGDKPTVFSKNQIGECIYPVYSNGEDNLGLQGFTNKYRVDKEAVTISARGSIGFSCIREPKFTPIVRLITIIPNDRINIYYLKYLFDYSVVRSNGSSQQQFTIPELKKMSFIFAPLDKQDEFASFVEQIDKSKIIVFIGAF